MKSGRGGRCAICRREFTGTETIFREVRGWERLRVQGGANAIARREETGRLAHKTCVERPGQMELA